MTIHVLENEFPWRNFGPGQKSGQNYSVEIPIKGLSVVYQFKIWKTEAAPMFILVKAGSGILSWLKVRQPLNLKYHSNNFSDSGEYLKTEIHNISKQEHGRFKGHYLVDFEILDRQDRNKIHWHYGSNNSKVSPILSI